MNVVFLIGNGFDIGLDLPTRYSQFYDYYTEPNNQESHIQELKKEIEKDPGHWSDLELALGEYVSKLDSKTEIKELHRNLVIALSEYLTKVEENYDCNDSQKGKLFNDFLFPENHFLPVDKDEIISYKQKWKVSRPWIVNIITFNYTSTLEKLIGYSGEVIPMGHSATGNDVNLVAIEHIHGTTSKGMVLGVNDESQFRHEAFKTDRLLRNTYIKPDVNECIRTGHDLKCQQWVQKADLICLFGLSLGNTDKRWWEYIGEQLKINRLYLLIFEYIPGWNHSTYLHEAGALLEEEDGVRDKFLSYTTLTDDEKEIYRNKILVRINNETMFNIDRTEFQYTPF